MAKSALFNTTILVNPAHGIKLIETASNENLSTEQLIFLQLRKVWFNLQHLRFSLNNGIS